MPSARPDPATLSAFAVSILLGGGNAVAVSFSNRELAPFWGATLRFAAAAWVFLLLAFALRRPLPRGRALTGAVVYGVLGFALSYALAYYALTRIPPGLAQTLLALVPLFAVLLAAAHGQERLTTRAILGALLALAGIAIVFRGQLALEVAVAPLLAIVLGAACIAETAVAVKAFPKADPVATNAVAMGVGAALLLALSLVAREPWTVPGLRATWSALAWLVLVGSVVVFWLYLFVLGRWTASATSYQFVLLPFVTLAISAWLTGERLTTSVAVGGALVLAGVWIGALSKRTAAPRAGPARASD